jgi:hypothetical protein
VGGAGASSGAVEEFPAGFVKAGILAAALFVELGRCKAQTIAIDINRAITPRKVNFPNHTKNLFFPLFETS